MAGDKAAILDRGGKERKPHPSRSRSPNSGKQMSATRVSGGSKWHPGPRGGRVSSELEELHADRCTDAAEEAEARGALTSCRT